MSLPSISSAYDTQITQAAAKWKQDIADQTFAALLEEDGTKAVGSLLTPSAVQPSPDAKPTEKAVGAVKEKEKSPAELFLEYMHKTPEQRWREAWLKQHGLTEEEFAALPPEKKQALQDQMEEDMKEQVRQTAEKKAVDPTVL